jgi:hypothetical protein
MQISFAGANGREKRDGTRALLYLIFVGLAIGGLAGATLANRVVNRNAQSISQTLAVSEYQNMALLQYKYADLDHARQSMQDLLSFMEQVEQSGLGVDRVALDFDRSLTYMRLALLDEKTGDIEASEKHIAVAAECSKKLGNKDPSEAHLRQIVTRLDSYLP